MWIPKLDASQLLLQRQTIPNVVGMARLGAKVGLRCRTEHAAEVFAKLKPGHTFLPPGKRQTFLVGPFPFGTLQASVAKALQSAGWTAKPVQAVPAKSHVQGLMFRVQSVDDPPVKVLRMAHGDVMFAREDDTSQPARTEPKVVATSATESFVSKACEVDHPETRSLGQGCKQTATEAPNFPNWEPTGRYDPKGCGRGPCPAAEARNGG